MTMSNFALEEEFGVSKQWIETGGGEMIEKKNGLKVKRIQHLSHLLENGTDLEAQEQFYLLFIDSKQECYAIKMTSRSMEPEIKEGSTIIIEEVTDQTQFTDGKIYVLVVKNVPFVKRVHMILGGEDSGKFKVSNDNEGKEQIVDPKEIERWYKVIYVINPV